MAPWRGCERVGRFADREPGPRRPPTAGVRGAARLIRQNLNANDPNVRSVLTAYFDGRNGMVPFGSADDYSCAFKLALPDESARRSYLQGILKAAGLVSVRGSSER